MQECLHLLHVDSKTLPLLGRSTLYPARSGERVQLDAAGQVQLKTPWRDGTTHVVMSPLEFMQRLAALVPRPRLHLIRFHRVLAPNARLRALVMPQGPPGQDEAAVQAAGGRPECERAAPEREAVQARSHRIGWARLPARVFDIDMQHCPNCGAGPPKIIAAILERPVIEKILTHLGLDPQPPPRGRAREAGHDRSRLAPAIRRPSRAADTSRHRLRSLAPAAGDTCAACRHHAA
ncbi:MAG: transposase [Burkholderiaceae bacterium]|nr:transposase [Burkholderiaceae bacterium]MEB2350707.1 transposase [Burkholderiaceae bacterium]